MSNTTFKDFLLETKQSIKASHAYVTYIQTLHSSITTDLRYKLYDQWKLIISQHESNIVNIDNPIVIDDSNFSLMRHGKRVNGLLEVRIPKEESQRMTDILRAKLFNDAEIIMDKMVRKINKEVDASSKNPPFRITKLGPNSLSIQYVNGDIVWNIFSLNSEKSSAYTRIYLETALH